MEVLKLLLVLCLLVENAGINYVYICILLPARYMCLSVSKNIKIYDTMAKQVESAGILVEVVHAGVSILLSQVDVQHNTVLLLGGFSHFYTQSSYTKSQVKLTQVDTPSS